VLAGLGLALTTLRTAPAVSTRTTRPVAGDQRGDQDFEKKEGGARRSNDVPPGDDEKIEVLRLCGAQLGADTTSGLNTIFLWWRYPLNMEVRSDRCLAQNIMHAEMCHEQEY